VNYYERYCGDYARDTAHLSLEQHGAYTVLLDVQYSTERGLPEPYADLYRICRAMSKAEQATVRAVADAFFPVIDGLRWNKRARVDIAEAQARIAAARSNGNKGGRPKKKTQQKPTGFSTETQQEPSENPAKTHAGEASPYAIPHTPANAKEQCVAVAPTPAKPISAVSIHGTRLDPLWVLPPPWAEWALAERPDWTIADVELVGLSFRDHWHSMAGARAKKADWLATWRNWVRNERRNYRTRPDSLPTLAERRSKTIDQVISQGKPNGRDIIGVADRVDRQVVPALSVDLRKPGANDVRGGGPGGPDPNLGTGVGTLPSQ
jgi:uncharacterized protein YdaU (DUF1376 family)